MIGPPITLEVPSGAEIDARLELLLQTESVRDAATKLSAETGLKRRDLYQRAVHLADEDS